MPTLISADDFRERFDISPDIEASRIRPHIGAASRRLRRWVGETNYTNAQLSGDVYADIRDDLENAEAHLAYHYALLGMHFGITSKGIVATSTLSEGKAITRYLNPEETSELARQFLEIARLLAEPYMLADNAATFEIRQGNVTASCV